MPSPSVPGVRALRHRNYRLYWSGQLVSLIGTWMQSVAQAWLVLTLTNDPFALGLLAVAQYGPILVFGLVGGVIADALPKRRILLVTQSISMVPAITLGILSFTGVVEEWHVIALAALLGFTNVVDMPTRQSFVYEMVGREDLTNAVALNATTYNAARIVGPAIAGLSIAAFGVPVAFMLNGASFIATIGCLLAMRVEDLRPASPSALPRSLGAVFGTLAEGLRYVARARPTLIALSVLGLVSTFGMNFSVIIPPLARDILEAGPSGFGFLMAASGLGAFTAALLMVLGRRPGMGFILVGALVLGSLEVVLSASRWLPLSMIAMYLVGLGGVTMAMGTNTLVQMAVPDALRGRVMAVYTTIFAGSTPVGGLIAGAVAAAYGTPAAILAGGLASIAIALAAGLVAWRWGLLRKDVASSRTVVAHEKKS